MDAEVVIFVGLQASGKSTFFRERFAATHEHLSKDLFRNNRNPNRRQGQLVEAALHAGRPVLVDNTNPTVENRRPLVGLGRRFGAGIVGYHFDSGVRGCLERNARREGRARVPDVAVFATVSRLVPPPATRASTSSTASGWTAGALWCGRTEGPCSRAATAHARFGRVRELRRLRRVGAPALCGRRGRPRRRRALWRA